VFGIIGEHMKLQKAKITLSQRAGRVQFVLHRPGRRVAEVFRWRMGWPLHAERSVGPSCL